MTWIKFCGTTNLRDALAGVAAGANAIGFIFAPSPRRIDPASAGAVVAQLPREVEKIGVFVNEPPARIAEITGLVGLTGVQLHGDEPAEQMLAFRQALGRRRLIKVLQARELLGAGYGEEQLKEYLAEPDVIDAVLLDSGAPSARGGTGKVFNWKSALPVAQRIRREMPLIIAGGLTPDNVGEAIKLFEPWGVDVVSGVERELGSKDHAKLRHFAKNVHGAVAAT